jgi:hypothetical protein
MHDFDAVYCRKCKERISPTHRFCPQCGADQQDRNISPDPKSTAMAVRPQANPKLPDSFALCDYRFLPCPKCFSPVKKPKQRYGNPGRATCPKCSTNFLVDVRGEIPVVCPACESTDIGGGNLPTWLCIFGPIGLVFADMQPTKYQCHSCGCHFVGTEGANVGFGFFIS